MYIEINEFADQKYLKRRFDGILGEGWGYVSMTIGNSQGLQDRSLKSPVILTVVITGRKTTSKFAKLYNIIYRGAQNTNTSKGIIHECDTSSGSSFARHEHFARYTVRTNGFLALTNAPYNPFPRTGRIYTYTYLYIIYIYTHTRICRSLLFHYDIVSAYSY